MSAGPKTLSELLEGKVPLTSNHGLLERISKRAGHTAVAIVLAPSVRLTAEVAHPLLEVLAHVEGDHVDVVLDALGPATEETWRVVSLLREMFEGFDAIIPFAASPGATLVALGADQLVMGPASSLAPLEPARLKALEHADGQRIPLSVGDARHYLKFAATSLVDPAAKGAAMNRLIENLDPLVVGATARAHSANRLILERCLSTHLQGEDDAPRVEAICAEFADGPFTHRFPITRRDCRRLGLQVAGTDGADWWAASAELRDYYLEALGLEGDLMLGERRFAVAFDGFIDSAKARRVLLRVTRLDERGHAVADRPPLQRWVSPQARDVVLDEELEL